MTALILLEKHAFIPTRPSSTTISSELCIQTFQQSPVCSTAVSYTGVCQLSSCVDSLARAAWLPCLLTQHHVVLGVHRGPCWSHSTELGLYLLSSLLTHTDRALWCHEEQRGPGTDPTKATRSSGDMSSHGCSLSTMEKGSGTSVWDFLSTWTCLLSMVCWWVRELFLTFISLISFSLTEHQQVCGSPFLPMKRNKMPNYML